MIPSNQQALSRVLDFVRDVGSVFASEKIALGVRATRRGLGAWVALLLGLTLTAVAWYAATLYVADEARGRFEQTTERMAHEIEQRAEDYRQLLFGARGFLVASRDVQLKQWHDYVGALRLEERYPEIQSIGFAPRVSSREKPAHTRAIRAQGFAVYEIAPAAERPEYFPVVLLDPFDARRPRALGYDLYSEPMHRVAMEHARDTARAALTNQVALSPVPDHGSPLGISMYLPLYRGDAVPAAAERAAQLTGFVHLSFRVADFAARVLQPKYPEVALQIFEGGEHGSLLYETLRSDAERQYDSAFVATRVLRFGAKVWTLRASGRPAFDGATLVEPPRWVLIGGALGSVLLFGIASALASARQRAAKLAARLEAQLREGQKQFRALADDANEGIVSVDVEGRIAYFNDAAERLFGYARGDVLQKPVTPLIPDCPELDPAHGLKDFLAKDSEFEATTIERIGRRADGTPFAIEPTLFAWRLGEARYVTAIVRQRDAAERKRSERALVQSEQRYRTIVDDSRGLICMHDLRGRLLYVNPAAAQALGYTQEEISRMNLRDVMAPAVRHEVDGYFRRIASLKRDRGLMRVVTKTGEERIWKYDNAYHEQAGGASYVLGHAQDVTELQLKRAALDKAHGDAGELPTHDLLTKVYRREVFHEHLNIGVERAKRRGQVLALLLLDLDDFGRVNDDLGHELGDELRKQVADALKQSLRESDVVGRIDGDRFAVMLDDIGSAEHAPSVAYKISERLCRPWSLEGHEVAVTVTIGSACYPADGADADALLKAADDALQAAKRRRGAPTLQARA